MRPDEDAQKPSTQPVNGTSLPPVQVDGFRRATPSPAQSVPVASQPEYRYDHELPTPKPQALIADHVLSQTVAVTPSVDLKDIDLKDDAAQAHKKKRSIWGRLLLWAIGLIAVAAIALGAGYLWYQEQLKPVSSDQAAQRTRVIIESGDTPTTIATFLKEKGLIRDKNAFILYTQLSGTNSSLKAGSYNLAATESVSQIVDHLVKGVVDEFSLTFYPGATLTDTTATPEAKKVDVTTVLKRAGYSEAEIAAALKKTYTHPVLADKPASADLEGYIYGETYRFSSSATVEDIITRALDELQRQVEKNNLKEGFKKQGLTLYKGITLASIVQREVLAPDQPQVAQVFYSRLKQGMNLGSDVTYHYAADKQGVARDFNLESPYNTRKYKGLPPGPISAPGLSALRATANPALGDYLFFVSGDDEKTYFARTNAEHDKNVSQYCHTKCMLP